MNDYQRYLDSYDAALAIARDPFLQGNIKVPVPQPPPSPAAQEPSRTTTTRSTLRMKKRVIAEKQAR